MLVGVPREDPSAEHESRVALIPTEIKRLQKRGLSILVEKGAGLASGFTDDDYVAQGAELADDTAAVYARADVILRVRAAGANPAGDDNHLAHVTDRHTVIGFLDALGQPEKVRPLANSGATALAMELMPRITRAQSMDALSSMATIAGYHAVVMAAAHLPKLFPMMITAAGTLTPAKIFVLGAGVAGLQAIATAKRLGAQVSGYDIRPEVKDQVQSVGGKFIELDLETEGTGDSQGYAKAQSDDFYKRQQAALGAHLAQADAVITTAAIPGRKAPILVTAEMVRGMRPGSVIVDLAAETGGNCELTEPGKTVVKHGVEIVGLVNVPNSHAAHASQMYARNISTFLLHLAGDNGSLKVDPEDEIVASTLVTRGGKIVNERVEKILAEHSRKAAP